MSEQDWDEGTETRYEEHLASHGYYAEDDRRTVPVRTVPAGPPWMPASERPVDTQLRLTPPKTRAARVPKVYEPDEETGLYGYPDGPGERW